MRLTTKGRFAVTAMIDVAMHSTGAPVTLAGVSDRQKISLSYLEQLFGKLRRHGLVASVRRSLGAGLANVLNPVFENMVETDVQNFKQYMDLADMDDVVITM